MELSLPTGLSQKELNAQLAELYKDRSMEGIKKQRQKASYKAMIAKLSNDKVSDFVTHMDVTPTAAEILNDNISPSSLL